jgi:hypothetical protein
MKKMTRIASAFLMSVALYASVFAQEAQPVQAQVSPAAPTAADAKPAAPVTKKAAQKKPAKKVPAQQPAAEAAVKAVIAETAPAAVAEVPQPPQVAVATDAVAAVSAPVKSEAAPLSSCPHCFRPLLAGYNGIIADLKPWMDEMDVQAADLDHRLSAIQKRINEKDNAIENARLGTDKKVRKAAVKNLNKEHKLLLKEYAAASDEKDAFYKKFSREIEKKTEGYNKIVEEKLKETMAAASQ